MVIQIKKEKLKYKVFSVRLHEETKKKLNEERKKSGLSWNRFIFKLLSRNLSTTKL